MLAIRASHYSSNDFEHRSGDRICTTGVPEQAKDQKPIDDFFASKLADRIRMDNWRKKLTLIRGEILEIADQGSQLGLVDLKRETVKLARSIERLEAMLGLKTLE